MRKLFLAIGAVALLGMALPTASFARGHGGWHGGFHGGGWHGGGWHRGGWRGGWARRGWWRGPVVGFYGAPYAYGGCYHLHRVWTPYGWRLHRIWVCG
jgi:hypothetical protein